MPDPLMDTLDEIDRKSGTFLVTEGTSPIHYFSLGRIMLSRIATIAAGTIPEPPKTSWSS